MKGLGGLLRAESALVAAERIRGGWQDTLLPKWTLRGTLRGTSVFSLPLHVVFGVLKQVVLAIRAGVSQARYL